ncbi:MAG TPA: SGNH/GDSL hydrolase family protein, partial [Candidatus Sulfotelmatobacter sp.]|nr:SGNH/GDSL hydrolase family protein [Candidatus Sulfotelmatobacter sp.]
MAKVRGFIWSWMSIVSILALTLPIPGARAQDDEDQCRQHSGRQREECEELYQRFHECQRNYRRCGFGTLGDSLTDEYQGSANIASFNWLEQLVMLRHLNFGKYEDDPAVRGEPRLTGYGYNWARWGASATEPTWAEVINWPQICQNLLGAPCQGKFLLEQNMPHFSLQVEGLVAQVAAGKVQVVSILIGHNDFSIYANVLGGTFLDSRFEQLSSDVVGRIVGAVDALKAAGPVMIVAWQIPSGDFSQAGVEGIARTYAQLAAALSSRGVPVFDWWGGIFSDPSNVYRTSTLPDGTTVVDLMFGDTYGVRVSPWVPASISELVDPGDPRAIGPCRLVGDWWWDPGAGLTA